jgi:hypothetical protein
MRVGAPRIGHPCRQNNMVDDEAAESEVRLVIYLQYSSSIASRGARLLGDLPKNCHLLPSTGILEPQDRYVRFNRFNRFEPVEGVRRAWAPG